MASNIIKLNRGDTYEFELSITNDDGTPYILKEDDKVYFGVMEPNDVFECSFLRKVLKAGDELKITLSHYDTCNLLSGLYYYSVKLEMNHTIFETGDRLHKVVTIINKTKFILLD